jgi:hypothetical protein
MLAHSVIAAETSKLNVASLTLFTIYEPVGSAGAAMAAVNQSLDPAALQQVMNNFTREMEKASLVDECWDDVVDMFDGDGVGEEADEVVDQVLDELGLEVGRKFDNLSCPSNSVNEAVYDEVSLSLVICILFFLTLPVLGSWRSFWLRRRLPRDRQAQAL